MISDLAAARANVEARSGSTVARTPAEAHLFMDVTPCPCGRADFDRKSRLEPTAEGLASVYEGPCAGCGAGRRFRFTLPAAPPVAGDGLFGAGASTALDAVDFLGVADACARAVPANTAPLSAAERAGAAERMRRAVAAVDEVLKLILPGEDGITKASLRSDANRVRFGKEPGRFRRSRLAAVRQSYAVALATLTPDAPGGEVG